MTRKDYVAIAQAIKAIPHNDLTAEEVKEEMAVKIADAMAADNPAFDRARFLKACGVQS